MLDDFLNPAFKPNSFDIVVSVATLHHLDAGVALARMRDLLRPGGTLLTIGPARARLPGDLPVVLAGVVASRWYSLSRTRWEHPSPTVWPPPQTFAEMRAVAARALPGVRYRCRLLWRYSLIWTKPHR